MNDPKSKLSRRHVVAGVGTVGALAAAAAMLPVAREADPVAAATGAKPEPGESAGYRLTAHVQRYYQTTKV